MGDVIDQAPNPPNPQAPNPPNPSQGLSSSLVYYSGKPIERVVYCLNICKPRNTLPELQMCTQLYAPMEIEKQIAFDKNNLASFRKKWATFKECLSEKYPPKYDFGRSLDEDFVRFESYLEAEILVSNFSLYEISVNRRKNITI